MTYVSGAVIVPEANTSLLVLGFLSTPPHAATLETHAIGKKAFRFTLQLT